MVWLSKGWKKFMEHYSIWKNKLHLKPYHHKPSKATSALKAANKYELHYPSLTVVIWSQNLLMQNVVRKDPQIIVLMCKIWTRMKSITFASFVHQKSTMQTVPSRILKGRIHGRMQTTTLKYSNRTLPVKLLYCPKHGSGKPSAGWASFQSGTSLKEGDVCVFVLVGIDNIEHRVSIFRRNVKT
ncbi:hypothetical protein BT93_E1390 [Corymbia citriodora subsp. variegata]|nr:hypothetical protein BT93_E1390 [Corymbia citriodora subsp. variegata]